MDPLWAQEKLRDEGGRLKADMLKRLVLMATGDEKAAEEAWVKRAMQEQRRNDYSATGA